MKPAFSVIFLTTLAGAAQGLFLALFGAEVLVHDALASAQTSHFFAIGSAVALALCGLGLLASFFHLGHPERAWRAAAMWRTSWLSREVIALPVFMACLTLYGCAHALGWGSTLAMGAVTTVACVSLFVCTAMIYACIRFLQEWASPLTLVNYIVLGCASGLSLAAALSALMGVTALTPVYVWCAVALTALGWVTRGAALRRNARLKPKSTVQSAIGIKHPRVVQKAQGFMGGSFNTREFFHGRSATLLRSLKWTFLLLSFALPLVCLALGLQSASTALICAACVIQYAGLLVERWFFFAQANHPQNLYYQTIS